MMPPPRYHFPSRPWPGQTVQARRFISGKMSQIARFASLETTSPPFVGGWELPGFWGVELPFVLGVANGDASKKNVKPTAFFYSFWEAFWGTLFACFSFNYVLFFWGGASDKCGTWRSLILGFCLSSSVAVLSLAPFHQLMLWRPVVWILKGIPLWKRMFWVMKAVPLLNPKPDPKPKTS